MPHNTSNIPPKYVCLLCYQFVIKDPQNWIMACISEPVNGPYLLDNLMIKLRLPVVLYVSFAVGSW